MSGTSTPHWTQNYEESTGQNVKFLIFTSGGQNDIRTTLNRASQIHKDFHYRKTKETSYDSQDNNNVLEEAQKRRYGKNRGLLETDSFEWIFFNYQSLLEYLQSAESFPFNREAHHEIPLIVCTMYFCPLYVMSEWVADDPGLYFRSFMTLDLGQIQARPNMLYNTKHPRPVAGKTYFHYWSLMTINPLLNLIGVHRIYEKITPIRVQDVHSQIKRLLPLFSACRAFALRHGYEPCDSDVVNLIEGSPRASLFPDRVYVPVGFEALNSGSFFPIRNLILHPQKPVHLVIWDLMQQQRIHGPVTKALFKLLEVFWEDKKLCLWLDILNPENICGSLFYLSAIFPGRYDGLSPSADRTKDGFLQDNVVDLRLLESPEMQDTIRDLQKKLVSKLRVLFTDLTDSAPPTWALSLALRICVAEEAQEAFERVECWSGTISEALESEFERRGALSFTSLLDPDDWQPNLDLAKQMNSVQVEDPGVSLWLRALAAYKTPFLLPSELGSELPSGHYTIPFAGVLADVMGYSLSTEGVYQSVSQPEISSISSDLWHREFHYMQPNVDYYEGSARQRISKFLLGLCAWTCDEIPATIRDITSGNASPLNRRDVSDHLVLLHQCKISKLHPAGLPSASQVFAHQLTAYISSHYRMVVYCRQRLSEGQPLPTDHDMLFTPLGIKASIFKNAKEAKDYEQKKDFGGVCFLDVFGPHLNSNDLPVEDNLPDPYAALDRALSFIHRAFEDPGNVLGETRTQGHVTPKNSLIRLFEKTFVNLRDQVRLQTGAYEDIIYTDPWFSKVTLTLMCAGYRSQENGSRLSHSYVCDLWFLFRDRGAGGGLQLKTWMMSYPQLCELALLAYIKAGLDRYPQFWKLLNQRFYAPATFFRGVSSLLLEVGTYLAEMSRGWDSDAVTGDGKRSPYMSRAYALCASYRKVASDRESGLGLDPNPFSVLNTLVEARLESLQNFMMPYPNPVEFNSSLLRYLERQRTRLLRTLDFRLRPEDAIRLDQILLFHGPSLFCDSALAYMLGCIPKHIIAIEECQVRFMLGSSNIQECPSLRVFDTQHCSQEEVYSLLLLSVYVQWIGFSEEVGLVKTAQWEPIIQYDEYIEPLERLMQEHHSSIGRVPALESKNKQVIRSSAPEIYYCPPRKELILPMIDAPKRKLGFKVKLHEQLLLANRIKKNLELGEETDDDDEDENDEDQQPEEPDDDYKDEYDDEEEEGDEDDDDHHGKEMDVDSESESESSLPVDQGISKTAQRRRTRFKNKVLKASLSQTHFVKTLRISPLVSDIIFKVGYNDRRKRRRPDPVPPNSDAAWDLIKKQKNRTTSSRYRELFKAANESFSFAQSRANCIKADQLRALASRDARLNKFKIRSVFPDIAGDLDSQVNITPDMLNPRNMGPKIKPGFLTVAAVRCFNCRLFFEPVADHFQKTPEGYACLDCIYPHAHFLNDNLVGECMLCCKRKLVISNSLPANSPLVAFNRSQQEQRIHISHLEKYPGHSLVLFDPLRASLTKAYVCKKCIEGYHVKQGCILANALTKQTFVCLGNDSAFISVYLKKRGENDNVA